MKKVSSFRYTNNFKIANRAIKSISAIHTVYPNVLAIAHRLFYHTYCQYTIEILENDIIFNIKVEVVFDKQGNPKVNELERITIG